MLSPLRPSSSLHHTCLIHPKTTIHFRQPTTYTLTYKQPSAPLPSSALAPPAQTPTTTTSVHAPALSSSRSQTSTPVRSSANNNGADMAGGGRAPLPADTAPTAAAPSHPVEHGAPFRKYLNSKVTPSVLAGMKMLALERYALHLLNLNVYLIFVLLCFRCCVGGPLFRSNWRFPASTCIQLTEATWCRLSGVCVAD